jgi:hypothetical protein
MSIPVQVQFCNHVLQTHMPALPRVGDRVSCSFPASGIPRLYLQVARVYFHQPHVDFEGKECPEPFSVVVTTEDDPDHATKNAAAFKKLVEPSGSS